jgi:peptide/nickel transport system permease protein
VRTSRSGTVLGFLVRRLLWAVATIVLTACFAYGMIRLLRPEDYGGGENLFVGTWHDVDRAVFHLTLGDPGLRDMWLDGLWVDVFLVAGGAVAAVVLGVAGGVWCATRPRSWSARAVESVAMLFLCTPPYVLALGMLLLFEPTFGAIKMPLFFEVHSYRPPLEDPWAFTRSMLVPWLCVGAPLGAAILRLTGALTIDAMGEHWVRTARAKGVRHRLVVRRHAAPSAYPTVASLFGAAAPILVTNVVLVEVIFSVPGFFRHLRRAFGQNVGGADKIIDIPMIQAISIWAAVLIVALSLIGDLAIARVDPRIRSGGRPV